MTTRSTAHGTFVVERTYDAPPARVFAAWSSQEAKARWFVGTMDGGDDFSLDFRIDGREVASGGPAGGAVYTYTARFHDIVPDQRIVYSYVMDADDVRISASVVAVEFVSAGAGTALTFTDAGVYLDGSGDAESRQHGAEVQLDTLATTLN